MHINKTGGTSIEKALKWSGHYRQRLTSPEKHIDVRGTVELYGKENWEKYFTFTFVRNPWDRMVSLFFWRKKIKFIPKNLTFKEFVMNFSFWRWSRNAKRKRIKFKISRWYQRNSKPQCLWFDDEFKFDYVGRFETLQQDFNIICGRLDIKKIELPHKLKTNHSHYSEYYDKETKNEVYKIWGADADLFKYEFGN